MMVRVSPFLNGRGSCLQKIRKIVTKLTIQNKEGKNWQLKGCSYIFFPQKSIVYYTKKSYAEVKHKQKIPGAE